ncbi:Oidioi.mRNA.OKI2018_I69.chr2.g6365.t1.cds [Oikopleura dioica]|uniref:Oidioi.mRNA.OKI2018_I69.chr2.g6365.t1.cds n=1 Tax=Oikopleura dioica TaxID=34765 RepID=A0ABN7T9Q9_OIKDI|nr:Oidioi.mRNA.OKI2018_I69.chr2.g6365.t1.cds [Oikopleura dioica]
MTEEVMSILAYHGLSIDDLSQVRIVNPEAADATQTLKTNNDEFVSSIEDINKLIKDFSEKSSKLAEQVKTRKLNAIAVRTRLQAAQRQTDIEKNSLLEKIEEYKLLSERLRAEHDALRKIEQNQNALLQQFNS